LGSIDEASRVRFARARVGRHERWAAVWMTQQYLVGELSVLLARLQAAVGDQACAGGVARLRQEAETVPVMALTSVVLRALGLIDAACWDSLTGGDIGAFACQAAAGAQLCEFGACACLLDVSASIVIGPRQSVNQQEVEQ
jgi:hypothetical protein